MNAFMTGFFDEMGKTAAGKRWIDKAIKKPGALHEQLDVARGKKIPSKTLARAAAAPGKLGMRARLAEKLKKMKK